MIAHLPVPTNEEVTIEEAQGTFSDSKFVLFNTLLPQKCKCQEQSLSQLNFSNLRSMGNVVLSLKRFQILFIGLKFDLECKSVYNTILHI